MLTYLEIKNGAMTPFYDIYNDNYTVTIKKDVEYLKFDYILNEKTVSITVNGNSNLSDGSIVSLLLSDGEKTRTILLNIIKENSEQTSELKNYFTSLEVKKNETIPEFIPPLIGGLCFMVIAITFSILFHKGHKKN